jgi:hypothetical protein
MTSSIPTQILASSARRILNHHAVGEDAVVPAGTASTQTWRSWEGAARSRFCNAKGEWCCFIVFVRSPEILFRWRSRDLH